MLRSSKHLMKYDVQARDGVVGRVSDFLFDDLSWSVRYLVVETGKWLPGRKILVSVAQCWEPDSSNKSIGVNFNKEEIENGPALDDDAPVPRQYEIEFAQHFNLVPYWAGAGLAGQRVPYPPHEAQAATGVPGDDLHGDPHLRSIREVVGYSIAAVNGDIGHLDQLIIDDLGWLIRYLVVDTRNWLPAHRVLIAPKWVDEINYNQDQVAIDLNQESIRSAPEYDKDKLLNREYEEQLYRHYGQIGYWEEADTREQRIADTTKASRESNPVVNR